MDAKAYDKAVSVCQTARAKLIDLQHSDNIGMMRHTWSEFLVLHQRAFTALRIGSKAGPAKGWCDQLFHQRSNDSLLKYVMHARNVDEHGIEPITRAEPGGVGIGPKHGSTLHIGRMEIRAGHITMDPETARNVKITLLPAEVHLVAVRDRGIVYEPPKEHLDEPLGDTGLLSVAQAAQAFLEQVVQDARRFVQPAG